LVIREHSGPMRLPESMILERRRIAARVAAQDWEWSLQLVGIPVSPPYIPAITAIKKTH